MTDRESAGTTIVHTVMARLEDQLEVAGQAVAADAGASPVLAAVVDEFRRKFEKTRPRIDAGGGSQGASREAVVELEQAADSAKWAATADVGLSEATRQTIVRAHDFICVFKSTGQLLGDDDG